MIVLISICAWKTSDILRILDYCDQMLKQLKILQIAASINPAIGGPSHVIRTSGPLLDSRFNHILLVIGDSNGYDGRLIQIPAIWDNRYGVPRITHLLRIRKAVQTSDILLIHGFFLISTIITILFRTSQTIFIMPHGSLEIFDQKKSKRRKRFFKYLINLLINLEEIKFLVASDSEARQVLTQFPKSSVAVVGLGLSEMNKPLRAPKVILSEKISLLTISRIAEVKRIDILIRVVQLLKESGVNVKLNIAGSGSARLTAKLMKMVQALDLNNEIQFLGHVAGEKKWNLIDDSDIFILASDNENFAISAAEAAFRGVPVVISQNIGFCDFVQTHKSGFVSKSNDPLQIFTAIREVVENYANYEKCSRLSSPSLNWDKVILNWQLSIVGSTEENY